MVSKLELIEINGANVWVEVDDLLSPSADARKAFTSGGGRGGVGDAAQQLTKTDLTATLKAIIAPVHAALEAAAPEEVSIELTLGIKGEVGIFVAKSEGNASLKVTAKWKFDK